MIFAINKRINGGWLSSYMYRVKGNNSILGYGLQTNNLCSAAAMRDLMGTEITE